MSKLADMLPRTPWPDCLLVPPPSPPSVYACACMCVLWGDHPPSLSIRPHSSALRPVKHSWDISPPLPPPPTQLLSSPPPSYLSSPSTLPRLQQEALIQGCWAARGAFPFLSASKTPRPSSLSPSLLINIKESAMSLLHCVCFRCSVIDIDMIGEGKEQKSLRPIHNDCFSFLCCFWGASSAKTTRSVFCTGCHKMRASVLCNKCHATYSQSLHYQATVSSWTFHREIQSEAVAQNKCFEMGERSRLPCHLIAAFKLLLHPALQTIIGVPVNFFCVCTSPLLLKHHFLKLQGLAVSPLKGHKSDSLHWAQCGFVQLVIILYLEQCTGVVSRSSLHVQHTFAIANLQTQRLWYSYAGNYLPETTNLLQGIINQQSREVQ